MKDVFKMSSRRNLALQRLDCISVDYFSNIFDIREMYKQRDSSKSLRINFTLDFWNNIN